MTTLPKATLAERSAAQRIEDRARGLARELRERAPRAIADKLVFVHENIVRIDLEALSRADTFNLVHDVWGIGRHLDRPRKRLTLCFIPRFAMKEAEVAE